MTAEEFNTLDTGDQIRLALCSDSLVAHRSTGPRSMHLYALGNFYVEVEFTTRRKSILRIFASKEDTILVPYLEQIDLSELFL